MQRIHLIIAVVIFIILTAGAAGAQAKDLNRPLTEAERILAITLIGEARGEGELGMYAVGCVIQKRAQERNLSLKKVCLQNATNKRGVKVWQFSCWGSKKNVELLYNILHNGSLSSEYAKKLARVMQEHNLMQEMTGHANHYYSHKIMKRPPSWAKGFKATKTMGNHTFYKLPWASNNK